MQFNANFPAVSAFTAIAATKTLAFFEAGGCRLLIKKVDNVEQALACGGFLIYNTANNTWFYASGVLAAKLAQSNLLPCAYRLEVQSSVVDMGYNCLSQGYRFRPRYKFYKAVDSADLKLYAVITTSFIGFGSSGVDTASLTGVCNPSAAVVAGPAAMEPQAANISGVTQLTPVLFSESDSVVSLFNYHFNMSSDYHRPNGIGPGQALAPSLFELGLVLWPKSLKDTWADGRDAILARVTGDAKKYAPEAFGRTLASLPSDAYPFALCRTMWQGQAYRGRDPRNAAVDSNGMFGKLYTGTQGTPGTSVTAPSSSGAVLDEAKYEVVSAINLSGNDVYMGYPAESNIGISVPCIHQLAFREYSTTRDTFVSSGGAYGIGLRGVLCVHARPTPQAGPLGRFMGAEAGAVWRHVWPGDYYDVTGLPKTILGRNIDIEGGTLEKTTEIVNIELRAATDWPGIPTDPAAKQAAIASNNDLFNRKYAGPIKEKDDVAAEKWAVTIVGALAQAVDRFTQDVEKVADERR